MRLVICFSLSLSLCAEDQSRGTRWIRSRRNVFTFMQRATNCPYSFNFHLLGQSIILPPPWSLLFDEKASSKREKWVNYNLKFPLSMRAINMLLYTYWMNASQRPVEVIVASNDSSRRIEQSHFDWSYRRLTMMRPVGSTGMIDSLDSCCKGYHFSYIFSSFSVQRNKRKRVTANATTEHEEVD